MVILKEIVFRFIAVLFIPVIYLIYTVASITVVIFSKERFIKEK